MQHLNLTGIVINNTSYNYPDAKSNYNLSIEKNPCIIVFCLEEKDIINALKYAKYHNIHFRIRSGRHDFEANSNINCGIVIDISKIDYVTIDEENSTATVGGGILFGKIYSELIKKGYTLPGGTCSDVGATGLTSVGGIGYATRYFGLTLDNLLEITLINNKGEKIIANETINKELFWAIKGSPASSYGVVTSLKYKIHKVDNGCFFTSTWSKHYFVDLIDTFQNLAYTTDNRLTLNLELSKNEQDEVNLIIDGQFFGLPYELFELLEPLFKVDHPNYFDLKYIPYKEAIEIWGESCFPPNKFKNSGAYIYDILSKENILKMVELVEIAPKGLVHYIEFLSLGGAVLDVDFESSSFAHRDARFVSQIKSIWQTDDQEEDSKNWTNKSKAFLDSVGFGNYRGFTDFNISNWQEQYYKDNYKKLQLVKNMYDMENFFSYFQGIQPTTYSYDGLTGNIITPDSLEYNTLRKNYNLHFDYYPFVIVYADCIKDVQNAICWSNQNHMIITIRCGGHNYEAFSVSNDSLLLDISNMTNLKINKMQNLVTIGSGYNLGNLYNDLYKLGYQFTGGTCPGVGISGLVSGGGVGLSGRLYGLACDNLVQLKLINQYGELVVANNCVNSDLFWACRGAGGANFGVFVEFTFKVRPVNKITYISISWPKDERFNVIDTYQKYILNADKRITLELTVTGSICKLDGFAYTTKEESESLLYPILSIPNKTELTIEYIPFIDAVNNIGASQQPPNNFKNSAGYIYEQLPTQAINIILNNLDNAPSSGFSHSVLFIPLSGQISENKDLNTSYAHRDAQLLIQYVSRWHDGDDANSNIEWIRKFREDMIKYAYNDYVNFPDLDIVNYLKSYFGKNTNNLINIKNKYNPDNLFQFPQSL